MIDHARKNTAQTTRDGSSSVGASAVGRELRDAREALGITVADMADALRIRAAHIEALEDGRFFELPGRPYTFGFARSIARHLGLDPDAVAMRLRDEVTGVARPVELVFPESTEDKRLSRTGWIVISLVLVAAAYAAWLAMGPGEDRNPPEFAASRSVPNTPPDMIAPEPAATEAGEVEDKTPETTVGASPVADPEHAPALPPAAVTQPAQPFPIAPPAPIAPTPRANSSVPQAPAATAPGRLTVPGPAAVPPGAANAPAPAPGDSAAASADDEDEDVTPEPSAVAAVPAFPATVPAGRVVLRARQDSWVQIQAANGATVMARNLRAGESYVVPEQSGLRLTTGNAGALEVVVDGQIAPALGQIGAVRRNVTLDPGRLKAGTALE
ncbi:MAG: RodZ domain-containing protein [Hyphomicrobium sp.]